MDEERPLLAVVRPDDDEDRLSVSRDGARDDGSGGHDYHVARFEAFVLLVVEQELERARVDSKNVSSKFGW